ncbi:MAG: hypothetical protein H5T86_02150 [Armatimonadetes bacterium]|nr:hypothetical protein [Armatimonadota bacterium]
MTIEKTQYAGWPNCYRVSNGIIELVATCDVGPRIIRLGFVGERNEFKEYADQVGKTGGDEWRIYGGHRLWHSPERKPRSYAPDNEPVDAQIDGPRLILTQPTEKSTGIRKQIVVEMAADKPAVRVVHRLRNEGPWPVKLAAWALSVMAPGGMCVIPFPRHDDPAGLLPNRAVVLWPYTDCTDPRLRIGRDYLTLRQDENATRPIKVGVARAIEEWIAYVHDTVAFVKRYDYVAGAEYPDFGSCVETYTNAEMLEVETVGPLTELDTNEELEHIERWYLLRLPQEVATEEEIERVLWPLVHEHTR